jgi:hypothetical protein
MRDGDSTRQSTHQELLDLLTELELPFVLLQGPLAARVAQAQALIRELPRSGLKLDAKLDAKDERDDAIIRWRCACCPPNLPLL